MSELRQQKLKNNFQKMFWISALQNIGLTNMLGTLFYLHRNLTLADVFYLSIVWAITNLLFEVPSSYLADYWGRKQTIILGIFFACIGDLLFIFAHSFWAFVLGMFFCALQFAMFSGTDEALIYDSAKELGDEHKTLKHLGNYFSARNILLIAAPLIGALIAKDLLDWQFVLLIFLEFLVGIVSLFFAFQLLEPKHFVKVEEEEGQILKHVVALIKNDPILYKAILTRTLIFTSMFMIWRFHQEYFLQLGITVIQLGIIWTLINLSAFILGKYFIANLKQTRVMNNINIINILVLVLVALEIPFIYFSFNIWYIIVVIALIFLFEQLRWPLYSQLYNQKSSSFNRATTLSLSNFLKSILDLPLLFIASVLVVMSPLYVFIFSFVVTLFVYVGARFRKRETIHLVPPLVGEAVTR